MVLSTATHSVMENFISWHAAVTSNSGRLNDVAKAGVPLVAAPAAAAAAQWGARAGVAALHRREAVAGAPAAARYNLAGARNPDPSTRDRNSPHPCKSSHEHPLLQSLRIR
jgi:hypothetical protein